MARLRTTRPASRAARSLLSHTSPPPLPLLFTPNRDRQLFVTYKGKASTGFYTDYNHITQNFLLSNYESQEGIDNVRFVVWGGFFPNPASQHTHHLHNLFRMTALRTTILAVILCTSLAMG